MEIQFKKKPLAKTDTIILPTFTDKKINMAESGLDKASEKLIKQTLDSRKNFDAKAGETLIITTAEKAVIILGLGDKKDFDAQTAETAGGKACAALKALGSAHAAIVEGKTKHVHHIAAGAKLRSYSFDKYKAKKDTSPKRFDIISDKNKNAEKDYERLSHVLNGIFTARDLVNEAPNTLYPESYAKFIKDKLKPLGLQIEILDDKKMEKLGMGAILAVGKGSERKPRIVIMRWNGGKKSDKPIALVGKGVTFDTGGISLKPGAAMDEMKMDMGGSAAVVGTMQALAARNAKANVVGIVGLAENMPASNAYRPGDIITSYAGKTIEVLNTDAEGRLVLADCLTYVQEKDKPSAIIDLATLTGAIMVALGHEYCGTFVNDDSLWKDMDKAAATANEKIWRMPLDPVWSEEVVSDVADLRNLGKSRNAGASTAAAFLEHFIDEGTKWAHMDIAGTAWKKSTGATTPKYATGFGVRTLEELVYNSYENHSKKA